MPHRWFVAILVMMIGPHAAAQDRPATEAIGSWVLTCASRSGIGPCQLRHRTWLLPPVAGAPSVSFEAMLRGHRLVPVVAVRGLSMQTALAGMLAVQTDVSLRFDNGTRRALACGLDGGTVVCPTAEGEAGAASELQASRAVLIEVRLRLPGTAPLPEQSRRLDLQRTVEALSRFQATAPVNESAPAVAGLDWRGFLNRLTQGAGPGDPQAGGKRP